MGAWGIGILENDTAANLMYHIKEMSDDALFTLTSVLLSSRNEEEAMLGVAIVDAAINGVDIDILEEKDILGGNISTDWFANIPCLEWYYLQGCIYGAIYYAKENIHIWNGGENQKKRLDMYNKILKRNGFKV